MKSKWILMAALSGILPMALPGMAQTPAAKTTDQAQTSTSKKAVKASTAPTEQEITDAKAKGLVWANTKSKVYHKEDSRLYGKTKNGKFMTEDEAVKAGYRAAKETAAKNAKAQSTKPAHQAAK